VKTQFLVSVIFSLTLAALVIAIGNYYAGPSLLLPQIVFVAGPTLVPLLILPRTGKPALAAWIFIAVLLVGGWSYVVYVDTRPYTGGGASFAWLIGWFACFVALILAASLSAVAFLLGGRRRPPD